MNLTGATQICHSLCRPTSYKSTYWYKCNIGTYVSTFTTYIKLKVKIFFQKISIAYKNVGTQFKKKKKDHVKELGRYIFHLRPFGLFYCTLISSTYCRSILFYSLLRGYNIRPLHVERFVFSKEQKLFLIVYPPIQAQDAALKRIEWSVGLSCLL